MNDQLYRVYNECKYNIGVTLQTGMSYNIRPKTFVLLNANDIAYIENACRHDKFFAKGMLSIRDDEENKVDLRQFRIVEEEEAYHSDTDIQDHLKQSAKKIEAWLETIEDKAELFAIWDVAKDMDLPASKLKVLNAKIPNREWI